MTRLDMSTFLLSSMAAGYAAERGSASAKKVEITVPTMTWRETSGVNLPQAGLAASGARAGPRRRHPANEAIAGIDVVVQQVAISASGPAACGVVVASAGPSARELS
jgi:hypothetical protein